MSTKNVVDAFREAIQDILVPEIRSMKVSIDSLRTEMQLRDENQARAVQGIASEMKLRDEKQTTAIHSLSEKLDFAIDIRERLASLEARMPRQ
ncbi:hypothetical protein [Terriglobus saanensis]|uniref:Uncharacterized protein n=1 Tax=Terriglobus saanensis (strain ATCC BAA-1853 / DSM 23119 / SP1PR4) TaxID=401053 RepID=E8V547_TERSS|nr:hypothetical protein [Terriglobus saanensis]ADV83734.1 hypothetical protein AciPR4_2974 [Terriglobus saanensis SP1PR4]